MRTIILTLALAACVQPGDDSGREDEVATASSFRLPSPATCAPGEAARIGPLAFSTAQRAVDAAVDGDVVTLCRGTIVGGLDVNTYASLAVVGETGDPADVVIDASSTGWGLRHAGRFGWVWLGGFTVVNANGNDGFLINKEISTISNIVFEDSSLIYSLINIIGHSVSIEKLVVRRVSANHLLLTELNTRYQSGARTRPVVSINEMTASGSTLETIFDNAANPFLRQGLLPRVVVDNSVIEDNVSNGYLISSGSYISQLVFKNGFVSRNQVAGLFDGYPPATLTISRSAFADNQVGSQLLGRWDEGVQVSESLFHRNIGTSQGFLNDNDKYRFRDVDFGTGADDNYPLEMSRCPPLDFVAFHQTTTGACPP